MAETEDIASGENSGDQSGGQIPVGMVPKAPSKRGRPPGSKNKNSPLDTGYTGESRATPSADVNTLEAAKFIGVGFVALVELAESFVHSSCASKIEKHLPHKLVEFKEMAGKLGLQEKDREVMADSMTKIAGKYNFLTAHAPEIVLAVIMAQYGLRQMSLIKFVDAMTKERRPEVMANPVQAPTKQAA